MVTSHVVCPFVHLMLVPRKIGNLCSQLLDLVIGLWGWYKPYSGRQLGRGSTHGFGYL